MTRFSSLRTSWVDGCGMLFVSALLLSLFFVPFYSFTAWFVQEAAGFKMSPLAVIAFGLLGAVSLGPLALATIGHSSVHAWRQIFSAIYTFWLSGAKFILLCLVLILPIYIFNKVAQYIAQAVWGDFDIWIKCLVNVPIFIIAPFWTVPLWLRFSSAILGRDWVDRLSQKITNQRGDESSPHTPTS